MIEFTAAPPIGTILKLDEQAYELREIRPHTRQDGGQTRLLVWETLCPNCSASFVAVDGLKSKGLNRRCERCRKAGKPVKGKRGRRVKIVVLEP